MRRHLVALPAFLVKAHPPALATRVIVLDPHGNDGRVVAAVACGFTPRSVRGVAAGAEPEVRIHPPSAESRANLSLGERRRKPPINGVKVGLAVYQDVERIRRRLDRTEDLVRPRRALARLLQLEEQPAAAL